ncbi:MAG: TraB/GumN family protein [Sphingobacteriaceae bacterium]|nr:MAG: TraB/GumN family protein [Sphingobacteriaceae bacterium]
MKNISYFLMLFTAALLVSMPAAAQNKGLLWQISGKNIKHPTYLYGTIHLFDTSLYKVPAPVMAKLSQVKKVYFELPFSDGTLAEQRKYAIVADSTQQINKLMDTASLAKFNAAIKGHPATKALGAAIYRFKPIFITPMLLTNSKTVTIDMEMFKQASKQKIAVGGLETVAEQMKAIEAIPMAKQVQMMETFLKEYKGADSTIKKITEAYVKQDVDNLLEAMGEGEPVDASFNKTVLVSRNIIMANRINKAVGGQSTMFAVGAGHLGGADGLIALLRKKGYTLKAIPFKFTKAN